MKEVEYGEGKSSGNENKHKDAVDINSVVLTAC